ncbi:MAG: DUF4347 domain-containing protein [Saprospiraceae bacterium]|nr:DUF4347 domain-containing protein [Saprospiraceae bacterium]
MKNGSQIRHRFPSSLTAYYFLWGSKLRKACSHLVNSTEARISNKLSLFNLAHVAMVGLFVFSQFMVLASTQTSSNIYIDKGIANFPKVSSSDASVFQLFSHGRPGELLINNKWRNAQEIAAFVKAQIRNTSIEVQSLNIYGCEFAKGTVGEDAVSYLESNLGISVAASTNITGKDGDWNLEIGQSKSAIAISNYQGNLQYAPNDDFDGDGITNLLDIDDDNDGILDVIENGCLYGGLTNVSTTANLSLGEAGNEPPTWFYPTSLANPSDPNMVRTWTIADSDPRIYTLPLTHAVTNPIISISDNDFMMQYWTDQDGNPVTFVPIETTADTRIDGNRIYDVDDCTYATGTSAAGTFYAIGTFTSFTVEYVTNPGACNSIDGNAIGIFEECTNNRDTDGDGTPNSLDLDSDGDGCSDAYEGNATTNPAVTTFAGPYGTNGYANSLETTVSYGVNYYSGPVSSVDDTYEAFAVWNTINKCGKDSDSDGVPDITDLDDDNDGILDAVESPSCFMTAAEQPMTGDRTNVPGFYITSDLKWSAAHPLTYAINGTATAPLNAGGDYVFTTMDNGGEVFMLTFPNPVELTSVNLFYGPAAGSADNRSPFMGTFYVRGSNDGVNWVRLSADQVIDYSVVNSSIFTINQNAGNYKFYDIYSDGYASAWWPGNFEVTTTLNTATYNPSAHPKVTACTVDTDGDGIPNQLDLDSDNDGCSDAYEAGTVTASNTSTVSGPYGTNGFADGKETTAGSGVYNGTYTYNNAINSSIISCPTPCTDPLLMAANCDFDGDGILNGTDIDDDNDGVLDAVETSTDSDGDGIPNTFDLDSDNDGCPDAFEAGTVTATNTSTVSSPYGTNGFADGKETTIESGVYNGTYTYANAINSTVITCPIPCSDPTLMASNCDYDGDGINNSTDLDDDNDGILDTVETTTDSDGDGIPNSFDLDSDNDGCVDAIEGGATTITSSQLVGAGGVATVGTGSLAGDFNLCADNSCIDANGVPTIVGASGQSVGTSQNATAQDVNCPCTDPTLKAAKCDYDGDGIINATDIDDDNDGILDAVESPGCYYTATEANNIINVTTGLTVGTGTTALLYNDVTVSSSPNFAFTAGQPLAGANIFTVEYPTPVKLTSLTIVNAASLGTSSTGSLYGSNDGVIWTDLMTGTVALSTAANKTLTVNQNAGEYKYYRVQGEAIASSAAGVVYEITSILNTTTYIPSAHPKAVCIGTDTDGDGIANNFDLDSDNDGCVDAIEGEGTITTSQLVSAGGVAIVGTGSTADNMNLCGTTTCVDANGVPTLAGATGQSAGTSQNATVQDINCPCSDPLKYDDFCDFDGDGIPNYLDIDDDNDGILDVIENGCLYGGLTNVSTTANLSLANAGNEPPTWFYPTKLANPNEPNMVRTWTIDVSSTYTLPLTHAVTNPIISISDNDFYMQVWTDQDGNPVTFVPIEVTADTRVSGDTIYDVNDCTFATGTSAAGTFYAIGTFTSFTVKYITNPGSCHSIDGNAIGIFEECTNNRDTDGDGIPNQYDLDSDGDGCSDAYEGNATTDPTVSTFAGPYGTNGYADSLETTVSYGVNYYSGPVSKVDDTYEAFAVWSTINKCGGPDSDGDGIPDYTDLDDDNDGILDAVESPSCYMTAAEQPMTGDRTNVTGFYITSDIQWVSSNPITYAINGTNTAALNTGTSSLNAYTLPNGGEAFRLTFPNPVELTSVNLFFAPTESRSSFFGTFYVRGSNDGVNWVRLSADKVIDYSITNSSTFTINQNAGNYKFYDLYSTGSVSTWWPGNFEVTTTLNTTNYNPSAHPKAGVCTTDTDGDGIPNQLDLDSDGDGCSDAYEAGVTTQSGVTMLTGTVVNGSPNTSATTSNAIVAGPYDANGFANSLETTLESGIYENTYTYANAINSSIITCPVCTDTLKMAPTCDFDGDGITNENDLDDDNDGITDITEGTTDTDGDGLPDKFDLDSDNDGITDVIESGGTDPDNNGIIGMGLVPGDSDGDGLADVVDTDGTNTGNPNIDTDGDGIPNTKDLDSDNDGLTDIVESGGTDTNNDGIADGTDPDHDGILSSADQDPTGYGDTGNTLNPTNTDGNGNPNYLDIDADNDGIVDNVEWQTTAGYIAPTGLDSDGDGIDNAYDQTLGFGDAGNTNTPTNTDGTDTPDYIDLNSDNTEQPDNVEAWDTNNNGIIDGSEPISGTTTDSDGDGLLDVYDNMNPSTNIPTDGQTPTGFPNLDGNTTERDWRESIDTDGDGIPNEVDLDDDNDGITDVIEGTDDTDGDGIPDSQDLDSDNDGITDVTESGGSDPDNNGIIGTGLVPGDSDGDGLADVVDTDGTNTGNPNIDTDGDGIPNTQDLDSDNDGLTDVVESGGSDINNDGIADGTDS